ncbi:MAG: LysM peptidoglycan-binding domain-containing protein, partial [Anaerolineae bacterium]|nr:LysM peptidoglycan-binding domain-containing protein [Anaerolineae bacterium]
MNENHMHDKDPLEKVETVVDHQQASGDSLIDTLASTIPQARADFADELEARLLAVRESQEDHMQQVYQVMDRQPRHRTYRLPVTLAAVLALVLITVALLSGRQPQQAMWMAQIASQTPTLIPTPTSPATPVPLTHTVYDGETLFGIANTYHVRVEDLLSANNLTDASSVIEVGQTLIIPIQTPSQSGEVDPVLGGDNLQPVVTAKNDIRRGTLLTPELFTLTYWEETQAGLVDNLDAIDGQYAIVDIPALTPLRTEDMLDRDPIGTLPRNLSYPLNIPISSEAAAQLHPGDRVQIMGELFYPYPDQTYHALTLLLVDLAEVLEVQNTGEQPQVVITIASNKDRLTIQEMIANGATLLLITETRAFSVANEAPPAAEVVTFGDAQAVIRTTTEDCRGSLMGRDLLSVRADPHHDAERVAQVVTQGQTVRVLGEITDPETGLLWYLIRTSTRDGWVTSNHVRLGETCPGLTRTDGELPAPLVLAQDDPRLAETASLPGEGWHMTLNTNSRMVEVVIPTEELPADLPIGDTVGIGTEMQFREAANQTRIEAVAPEPISSYRQYQMLAQATLVRIDGDSLVLSMHDDEAADVSWALDAGLPLTLAYRSPGTNSSEISELLPPGTVAVSIPSNGDSA